MKKETEGQEETEKYNKTIQSNFNVLQSLGLNLRNMADRFQELDTTESNDFVAEVAAELYKSEENLIQNLNDIIKKHNVKVFKLQKH